MASPGTEVARESRLEIPRDAISAAVTALIVIGVL